MPTATRRGAVIGGAVALALFALLVAHGTPAGLFDEGPYTSDFFDEQAEALLDGRLDVDPAVAGIEGFEVGGRTYLYFGLVPAILRTPVVAVAGDRFDGQLVQISMLLALALALTCTASIVWHARRLSHAGAGRPAEAPLLMGLCVAAVGISSPLLFLTAQPVVYHEAELWGAATTLLAVAVALRWWDTRRPADLALAGGAVAVALHTRASVGAGAAAALGFLGLVGLWQRRWPLRTAPAILLALLIPATSYAVVNHARFERWLSVPWPAQVWSEMSATRQAALAATDDSFFSFAYAPSAAATYLRPDGISVQPLFPWLTFREGATLIGEPTFDKIDRSASLPPTSPALVAAALVGLASLVRARRVPWLVTAVGLGIGLVPTLTISFIAHRYLADFVPLLVVLGAPGVWSVHAWAASRRARAGATIAAIGLVTCGTIVTTALTLQAHSLLMATSADDRRAFIDLQYDVDRTLFDRAPPAVVQRPTVEGTGRRGDIVLLPGCRAVYWSTGSEWAQVEAGPGLGWELRGEVPPGGADLITARGWTLRVERTSSERVRAVYTADGVRRAGPSFPLEVREVLTVEVALDPVNRRVTVLRSDEAILTAWLVGVGGGPEPARGWEVASGDARLCEELRGDLAR
jgi:hypothetical protein